LEGFDQGATDRLENTGHAPAFQKWRVNIDSKTQGDNLRPHDDRTSSRAPAVVFDATGLASVQFEGRFNVLVFPHNDRGNEGV
jgi:hypothetical protein